ncbi:MAG TPA: hypothetical protein VFG07_00295 [Thermoplasmata archaeon]|nr:hypothetical protein [Thermoplasmata archaeon]
MARPRVAGVSVGLTILATFLMLGVPASGSPHVLRTHLTVSPGTVGAPGDVSTLAATCPYSGLAWHCSLRLTESARSNANATWTSSSTGQATFSPSGGTLSPGSSVNVTVVISSCGGRYLLNFTGPQNIAQATFTCG